MNFKRKRPRRYGRDGKAPRHTDKESTTIRRMNNRRNRMRANAAVAAGVEPPREIRTSGWLTW